MGRTPRSASLVLGPSVRLLLQAILSLAVLTGGAPAWAEDYVPQQIIPGVGIGPARLGMTDAQVRGVLTAFDIASNHCTIDALVSHDRVIALGTRFGGCLQLALPPGAIGVTAIGTILLPEVGGIGGTTVPLIRAFGDPRRFAYDDGMAVLLWPNGLVARIAASAKFDIITYLAVVPPQTAIPPYTFLAAVPPSE